MIEQLNFQAFQCHAARSFILDQITVLVAENDEGKTSVLRGLAWAALNRWDGGKDEHVTWGHKVSEVELIVDGRSVKREKGSGQNNYYLDGARLESFYRDVPLDIAQLLKLHNDNFQWQEEAAFWLSLTGGGAATALNQLFNLDSIDHAQDYLSSTVRQAKSKLDVTVERLREAEQQTQVLAWTQQALADFQEIEQMEAELAELEKCIAEQQKLLKVTEQLESLQEQSVDVLASAASFLTTAENLSIHMRQISTISEIINLEDRLCLDRKALTQKEKQLAKLLEGTCPLCSREK